MNAAIDQAVKLGFTSRLPAEVYHALPGVSITRLKELQVSGLHYQYRLAHGRETNALTLGTATHCAVLEPERFEREFAAWGRRAENGNLCPRKGQYWDEFVSENPGKTIITEDDRLTALTLANAVRGDPLAMRYLESGDAEVSMQWQLRVDSLALGRSVSVNCRGRADWLTRINGEHFLVGLKTATARSFPSMAFSWAAYKLGYHMQWAFYQDGYKTLTGVRPKVKEIVVESSAPHDVAVYDIADDVLEKGREDYEALLRTLVDCESRDEWLGIAGGRELTFTLPSSVYETFDDIGDLGLEA